MDEEPVVAVREREGERSEGFLSGGGRRWQGLGYGVGGRPWIAFEREGERH